MITTSISLASFPAMATTVFFPFFVIGLVVTGYYIQAYWNNNEGFGCLFLVVLTVGLLIGLGLIPVIVLSINMRFDRFFKSIELAFFIYLVLISLLSFYHRINALEDSRGCFGGLRGFVEAVGFLTAIVGCVLYWNAS